MIFNAVNQTFFWLGLRKFMRAIRIADPHHLNAVPDPDRNPYFHINAVPDLVPAFNSYANLSGGNLRPLVYRSLGLHFEPSRLHCKCLRHSTAPVGASKSPKF